MYLPGSYTIAILLMFITMLCWGSWANTQKLTPNWRFELFYWDYTFGVLLCSVLIALTLGSTGESGLPFLADWQQTRSSAFWQAILSGVVFNIGNLLLVAGIAIAGMAVAFPIAIGIALVMGTALSYLVTPEGNLNMLMMGLAFILAAILLDAKAYSKAQHGEKQAIKKGIVVSLLSGVTIGLFYPFLAKAMSGPSAAGPYTALVIFSIGVVLCNIPFNYLLMRKPISGTPLKMSAYFEGSSKAHLVGVVGGVIWAIGMGLNLIAAQEAGPAIAYAFGQGATLIAAIWGVFIWREFKGVANVQGILGMMFVCYLLGLGFIGYAKLAA